MFDQAMAQEIRDQVGEDVPITASERKDPEDAVQTLWGQWLDLTAALQTYGVSHNSLCDASSKITEVFAARDRSATA